MAGFFTSIPQCVLGGLTTFLFATVCVSGIKVITLSPLNRRNRFVIAISLGLGLGVTIVPEWATNHLWPVVPSMSGGLRGFRCCHGLPSGLARAQQAIGAPARQALRAALGASGGSHVETRRS